MFKKILQNLQGQMFGAGGRRQATTTITVGTMTDSSTLAAIGTVDTTATATAATESDPIAPVPAPAAAAPVAVAAIAAAQDGKTEASAILIDSSTDSTDVLETRTGAALPDAVSSTAAGSDTSAPVAPTDTTAENAATTAGRAPIAPAAAPSGTTEKSAISIASSTDSDEDQEDFGENNNKKPRHGPSPVRQVVGLPRGTARTDMATLKQDPKYLKFKLARREEMAGGKHQAEEVHTGTATATETGTETEAAKEKTKSNEKEQPEAHWWLEVAEITLSFPPIHELAKGIDYDEYKGVLEVDHQDTRVFVRDGMVPLQFHANHTVEKIDAWLSKCRPKTGFFSDPGFAAKIHESIIENCEKEDLLNIFVLQKKITHLVDIGLIHPSKKTLTMHLAGRYTQLLFLLCYEGNWLGLPKKNHSGLRQSLGSHLSGDMAFLLWVLGEGYSLENTTDHLGWPWYDKNKRDRRRHKLEHFDNPHGVVPAACLFLVMANQFVMTCGNQFYDGGHITLKHVMTKSVCCNRFKSNCCNKSVLTWASAIKNGFIFPNNDDKLPNPLKERSLYATWCTLAPVVPPFNELQYKYDKYKHLPPYADEVVYKNDDEKVNAIQTGRTTSNHEDWEKIYLGEFDRVRETCLWDQWQKMLEEDNPYIPFNFPKLPGWVNCNLWIGDERPETLGPLKDPDHRFQWKKETLESRGLTQAGEVWEEVEDKNWT